MHCRSRLSVFALSLAICGWSAAASAEIKLPDIIGSNMVLQHGAALPIWGWAEKGETVSVSIAGQSATSKAGDDGRWRVTLGKLQPTPCDKPLVMTIKGSSGDAIALENVLVGEVWLCSGQSNMEMGVGATKGGKEAIAAADYPGIRLFWVPKERARAACSRCHRGLGRLQPEDIGSWRLGRFFRRRLFLRPRFAQRLEDARRADLRRLERHSGRGVDQPQSAGRRADAQELDQPV